MVEVVTPFASTKAPFVMLAFTLSRLGDIRFPFASRSLRTQRDSFPFTIADDTGTKSILATIPDRTARVDSPALPTASFTENR